MNDCMWITGLLDDENAVVELLPLQERMHVLHKWRQVILPITIGNDDGHFVIGQTIRRLVATAGLQLGLPFLQ